MNYEVSTRTIGSTKCARFGDRRETNQLGTRTLEMGKICGNGTGTENVLYDLKNRTKSIMEKSRGTESITEKSRGRESAKCDEGRRARQGFFRTRTGTKRPFNVQNGQDEMAKKYRGQLSETSSQVEQAWGHEQRRG